MLNCSLYLSGSLRSSVRTSRTRPQEVQFLSSIPGVGPKSYRATVRGGAPHEAEKEAWELAPGQNFSKANRLSLPRTLPKVKHASYSVKCSIIVNPDNHVTQMA
jgi:hypothetical protein